MVGLIISNLRRIGSVLMLSERLLITDLVFIKTNVLATGWLRELLFRLDLCIEINIFMPSVYVSLVFGNDIIVLDLGSH